MKVATNIIAIKLKIMTNRLKIVEIIKNTNRHVFKELDSEADLKQQQLQQLQQQYEIQENIKIISKPIITKRKAILE